MGTSKRKIEVMEIKCTNLLKELITLHEDVKVANSLKEVVDIHSFPPALETCVIELEDSLEDANKRYKGSFDSIEEKTSQVKELQKALL